MDRRSELFVLLGDFYDGGLISKAKALAEKQSDSVTVILFNRTHMAEAARSGADKVILLEVPASNADDIRTGSWIWEKIIHPSGAGILIAPATVRLKTMMAAIAQRAGAGMTADCTQLERAEDGRLLQVRPAYGGHIIAQIRTSSPLQMATVRPLQYVPTDYGARSVPVVSMRCDAESRVKIIGEEHFRESQNLVRSKVIIAGGYGVGSREGFRFLADFAHSAGASVGASRKAVLEGFAPYSCQVGQTGVSVHPDLYVAVGISGAVQHLTGMLNSGKIIAVNSDRKAPIFDYADYGYVGDWKEILLSMKAMLEKEGRK